MKRSTRATSRGVQRGDGIMKDSRAAPIESPGTIKCIGAGGQHEINGRRNVVAIMPPPLLFSLHPGLDYCLESSFVHATHYCSQREDGSCKKFILPWNVNSSGTSSRSNVFMIREKIFRDSEEWLLY